MDRYDGALFDCHNHYCEAADTFTVIVPRAMQRRCGRKFSRSLARREGFEPPTLRFED